MAITIKVEGLRMKLFKSVDMPEKVKNEKGTFEKTGKSITMTGYDLYDQMGSELYFVSPNNLWRTLEGKIVDIVIEASYDDYNRKNKFVLRQMTESAQQHLPVVGA